MDLFSREIHSVRENSLISNNGTKIKKIIVIITIRCNMQPNHSPNTDYTILQTKSVWEFDFFSFSVFENEIYWLFSFCFGLTSSIWYKIMSAVSIYTKKRQLPLLHTHEHGIFMSAQFVVPRSTERNQREHWLTFKEIKTHRAREHDINETTCKHNTHRLTTLFIVTSA